LQPFGDQRHFGHPSSCVGADFASAAAGAAADIVVPLARAEF
jgi:hypothetical protein